MLKKAAKGGQNPQERKFHQVLKFAQDEFTFKKAFA
jgi:hypothetical protein